MNIDLARRTLAAIEDNPDQWYQDTWRCGSGMCFAGWAATLAGAQWLTDLDNADDVPTVDGRGTGPATAAAYVRYDGDQIPHDNFFTQIKGARHVRDYARHVLGVTDVQAECMFFGHNDLWTLESMVDALEADPYADLYAIHPPPPDDEDGEG